jgi:hypothetical protein
MQKKAGAFDGVTAKGAQVHLAVMLAQGKHRSAVMGFFRKE